MSNPYYWPFPQRNQTMYMSTLQNQSSSFFKQGRQSSFLFRDIDGATPKQQIPSQVKKQNFINSTQLQPRPEYWRSIKKKADPLKHDDIEGSQPQAVEFKTKRVVDPLLPKYKLPSSEPVDPQPPTKFLRNTLDVSDIVKKKSVPKPISSPKNQPIDGNAPSKLFKTIDAIPRLNVQDINTDGQFISKRRENPVDPLNPTYVWRDNTYQNMGLSFTKSTLVQEPKVLNEKYGTIDNGKSKKQSTDKYFQQKARKSLDLSDIDGAKANSANQHRYFFEKRKDFREYMKLNDIEKSGASSLKKGIVTNRKVNPLIPHYDYPS